MIDKSCLHTPAVHFGKINEDIKLNSLKNSLSMQVPVWAF